MILHASLVSDQPQETAEMLANLLGGTAIPMPGPGKGAWHAAGSDPIGNYVEVLARGTEFHRSADGDIEMREGELVRSTGSHILIESPLEEPEILSVAERAGAVAKKVSNGFFELIACWIDDCQLVEILSPQMAKAYRALFEPERIREVVARLPMG